MMGGRGWQAWIAEYGESHQNPINRSTHLFGIPMIVLSLPLLAMSVFFGDIWPWAVGLFLTGWVLQFIGHAFEGKPPEFFKDWRFLLVGVRWWIWKMVG